MVSSAGGRRWGESALTYLRHAAGETAFPAKENPTSPSVGRKSPAMIVRRVLLPEPLGPVSAMARGASQLSVSGTLQSGPCSYR
jgi:hypothetical protein